MNSCKREIFVLETYNLKLIYKLYMWRFPGHGSGCRYWCYTLPWIFKLGALLFDNFLLQYLMTKVALNHLSGTLVAKMIRDNWVNSRTDPELLLVCI